MGKSEYRNFLIESFLFGAKGLVFVYDVTQEESYNDIEVWESLAKSITGTVPILVIGNKSDALSSEIYDEEKVSFWCDERSYHYSIASARTGENVTSAMEELSQEILGDLLKDLDP